MGQEVGHSGWTPVWADECPAVFRTTGVVKGSVAAVTAAEARLRIGHVFINRRQTKAMGRSDPAGPQAADASPMCTQYIYLYISILQTLFSLTFLDCTTHCSFSWEPLLRSARNSFWMADAHWENDNVARNLLWPFCTSLKLRERTKVKIHQFALPNSCACKLQLSSSRYMREFSTKLTDLIHKQHLDQTAPDWSRSFALKPKLSGVSAGHNSLGQMYLGTPSIVINLLRNVTLIRGPSWVYLAFSWFSWHRLQYNWISWPQQTSCFEGKDDSRCILAVTYFTAGKQTSNAKEKRACAVQRRKPPTSNMDCFFQYLTVSCCDPENCSWQFWRTVACLALLVTGLKRRNIKGLKSDNLGSIDFVIRG